MLPALAAASHEAVPPGTRTHCQGLYCASPASQNKDFQSYFLSLAESFPVLCSRPTQKGFSLKYLSVVRFFSTHVSGMDG